MTYKAEYIWIDGTEPTAKLRSKTKILADGAEPAHLGLRRLEHQPGAGRQARTACSSRCSACPDPIRGGDNILVLCEVLLTDMTPHPTNTRAALRRGRRASTPTRSRWFGIEQEYTFFKDGRPSASPSAASRPRRAATTAASAPTRSSAATSSRRTSRPASRPASRISGINAEVMPGQWEFQVGPLGPLEVADQLWVARWLLYRIAEDFGIVGHARPEAGEGRLERRRRPHQLLDQGDARGLRRRSSPPARRSAKKADEHIAELRRRHRGPPHRPARDRPVERVQLRRVRPRRLGAHPVAGRGRQEGLHRGSPAERQLDPYVVTRLIVDTLLLGARPSSSSTDCVEAAPVEGAPSVGARVRRQAVASRDRGRAHPARGPGAGRGRGGRVRRLPLLRPARA